jgi:hypothetical protein
MRCRVATVNRFQLSFLAPARHNYAPGVGDLLRTATGVVFVLLAAGPAYATLLGAAAAAIQPISLDFGETTVYAGTLRILRGEPLYQPIAGPPYTVTPYTPLYHCLAAALRAVFGEGFGPGRVLSLLGGVATALIIGLMAARGVRAVWVGAFAAVLFLALAFPGGTPWLGLYRVDTLGVALSVSAVAALSLGNGWRASLVAGILAGLAILCKQTFVAALAAGVVWQWSERPRLIAFVSAAALVVGLPCLWLQLSTGAFAENVLSPVNPFDASIARRLIGEFIAVQWLPILLTVACLCFRPWTRPRERLLFIYWLASSLQLIGLAKVGSNHNYIIEFAAASAMLGAVGAYRLLHLPLHELSVVAAVSLLVVLRFTLGGGFAQLALGGLGAIRTERTEVAADISMLRAGSHDPEFDSLVKRVREEPGIVMADPPDVTVLADRPVYFEPLIYSVLMAEGEWQPGRAVDTICSGQVTLLILEYRLGDHSDTYGSFDAFPPPVTRALEAVMRYEGTQANRNVYSLRSGFDLASNRSTGAC